MASVKDWSPHHRPLAIKLNAGNDRNGNPRRGWAIVDPKTGDLVDFVDEGYRGWGALKEAYPDAVQGPEFPTTPGVYRELKRESEKS